MFRLTLIPRAIALGFLFLALQTSGVQLFAAIQEENNSPPQEHGSAKRILTSLKSNSIEATTFGQDSSSPIETYFAGQYTTSRDLEASYYGLHATMDVYGHELKPGQWSSTALWVSHYGDGNTSRLNAIQVGWHRDGFDTTGCYNMDCPGFIWANDAVIAPGDAIHPVSHVPGPIQNITLRLLKDKTSGDWWVYYGFNKIPTGVGYFPKSLFSYLAQKANVMVFGGFVRPINNVLQTPPMGSGALPNGGKGRAASFTDLQFIDHDGNSSPITGGLTPFVTDRKCHSITPIDHGRCFYGGPGGCVR